MKTKSIFLDGQMIKARRELINSLIPGIVQGVGAFETMRVYNGKIFSLPMHFKRLFRGLRLLKIRSPHSKWQWERYLYQTIHINSLKDARIRLAVWQEDKKLRIAIVCQSIEDDHDRKCRRGLKGMISGIKRKRTKLSNIKSMDYFCFRQAFIEAEKCGFDEAILLNSRGEIAEGSRTNIFYVKKGALYTPPVRSGCLNGITRQIVIQCARRMEIPMKMPDMSSQDLLRSDEAFLTNSIIGIAPLIMVGNQPLGQKKAGKVTEKLIKAYDTKVHSSCLAQL